jgi:uncharacterized protein
MPMPVTMELARIIINETQDQQIIVLKEVAGDRAFPIVIGSSEAYAIDRRLKAVPHPRPLTHDLLSTVIEHLGGTLEAIEIYNLQQHTFFARLLIQQNNTQHRIDCRPSDAIALGIVQNIPIRVADHVLDEASN